MTSRPSPLILFLLLLSLPLAAEDIVTFPSGEITLHGVVYKPGGKGPFPAVVYTRGSAAGMLSQSAFQATRFEAADVTPYVDEQIQAGDCSFKDLSASDYVVGQVWGRTGSSFLCSIKLPRDRESRA